MTFRCKVSGLPVPQVSWYKNNICIDRSRNFTIGENDSGEHILTIDRASTEHNGAYTVKATNELGTGNNCI